MADIAGWFAPILITIAALMTAANAGARFTGWGFVVFAAGSISWTAYGAATDQANLVWQNLALLAVNLFGVWRWLFRAAGHDDGAAGAEQASAATPGQRLLAASSLTGMAVSDRDGQKAGQVVDAMIGADDGCIAYVVVSQGGIGGVGETLHAVPWRMMEVADDTARLAVTAAGLASTPAICGDRWPARAPRWAGDEPCADR